MADVSARVIRRRWVLAVRLLIAAIVWSAGLVIAALVVPVYNGQTTTNADGVTLTTATLVQVHGAKALIIVVIPLLVSLAVSFVVVGRGLTTSETGSDVDPAYLAPSGMNVAVSECVPGLRSSTILTAMPRYTVIGEPRLTPPSLN